MAEEVSDMEKAATRGVGKGAEGLKTDLRQQVTGAGMGQRLANTWRAEVYPGRAGVFSLRAAGLVFSRAPDIVDAFSKGVPIRSPRGFYLAIPTPAAGKFGLTRATGEGQGKERLTPGGWERRTGIRLRHVWRPGKKVSYLVADDVKVNAAGIARGRRKRNGEVSTRRVRVGATTTVIFLLVPQVRVGKRFDLAGASQKWSARLPDLIVQSWPEPRR
ncbi:hypothetical protein KHC23_13035 [Ancylobacter dichloromethanicus]|nr:hypothetical protein [Ancylobacter dichloromethanicus]